MVSVKVADLVELKVDHSVHSKVAVMAAYSELKQAVMLGVHSVVPSEILMAEMLGIHKSNDEYLWCHQYKIHYLPRGTQQEN